MLTDFTPFNQLINSFFPEVFIILLTTLYFATLKKENPVIYLYSEFLELKVIFGICF